MRNSIPSKELITDRGSEFPSDDAPFISLIRLLIASFLGALIGLERDVHGRSAGLRTNLIVSLGAAVFTILSEVISTSFIPQYDSTSILSADPTRIAANIIMGIGFIGAGVIIKAGFSVKGITTAACLWLSAGIGMSAGAGFYELALVVTIIGLASLILLNPLERGYAKDAYRSLQIITSNETNISQVIDVVKRDGLKIVYLDKERNYETNKLKIIFTVRLHHRGVTDKLSHGIVQDIENSGIPIYKIRWWHQ
jgi:putative Mg2+ transporter-C (MgtC) family protein